MSLLRAVPLPLRLAGIFLIGIVLFSVAKSVPSTVFVAIAITLWVIVLVSWAYDQGWLNPLARLPGVSGALGYLTNRRAQQISAGDGKPEAQTSPPGELNDNERRRIFASARQEMSDLQGNEDVKAQIEQRIIAPALENPENPFGSNAPAAIIWIAGPRGVGKTTFARVISKMLTGVGAVKTAKIITVRETDLRGGEFRSAIDLAQQKTRQARSGTLFLDDAGWLLEGDPYGGNDRPGQDFGLTLADVVAEYPREVLVIATVSTEELGRLKEDTGHNRWLGRLARRDIILDDLDDDALVAVLNAELQGVGWEMSDEEAARSSRRLMSDLRDRKAPNFDNAIACRRAAETLIEITNEEFDDLAARNRIGRDAIKLADDELE